MDLGPHSVAYVADRVWDGDGPLLERGVVAVEGDTIAFMGPVSASPADIATVELGDATILPGLIDAHVHLTWGATAAPHELVASEPVARTVLRAAGHCAAHLNAGVTTVRDLGSAGALSIDLAGAADAGVLAAPRILAAGRAIAMTGGHAHFVAREVDGADAVRAGVRGELKRGATCVKLMASGGVMGPPGEHPGAAQLTTDELRAAVQEGHRAGVRVAAHAFGAAAIRAALEAGVDTIEHGSLLDEEAAEAMASHGATLVPTLAPIHALELHGRELGLPEHMLAKIADLHQASDRAVAAAIAAGVSIIAGTDAGVPAQPHGELATELALLRAAGLSRVEAMRAGTSAAADGLGLGGETGRLRPGLTADLVVVPGNPLDDVDALRRPALVLRAGVAVKRSHPAWPC